MTENQKPKLRLEIAHVLFIDIVGYSKLRTTEQSAQIETLRKIVRGTEQFRAAEAEGKLLRLPTGDGGVFRHENVTAVAAIHDALGDVDPGAGNVRLLVQIGNFVDRTTVNAHANTNLWMIF